MRIFLLILSLLCAAACLFLGYLGFNGTLSQTEFLLINAAAELLLCLLLGHFMYRTYANHRRAKKLSQELTNAQAALQVQAQETIAAREQADAARAEAAAARTEAAAEATQPMPAAATPSVSHDTTTLYQTPFNK